MARRESTVDPPGLYVCLNLIYMRKRLLFDVFSYLISLGSMATFEAIAAGGLRLGQQLCRILRSRGPSEAMYVKTPSRNCISEELAPTHASLFGSSSSRALEA